MPRAQYAQARLAIAQVQAARGLAEALCWIRDHGDTTEGWRPAYHAMRAKARVALAAWEAAGNPVTQAAVSVKEVHQARRIALEEAARIASEDGTDAGERIAAKIRTVDDPECSICRSRHPSDDRHPCE